ncbi:MAG: UDP-N-acetylglucosamine 2-epimerase (non-hydrolyzing) [Actinomycetota bacterium]|nr:UDP-N-acetylglucosamine 2-epimerase (non-hydrolyzing) [Actinomycetota bacterium]
MTRALAPGRRHYLTAFGTRPEIIKLAPLVAELRSRGNPITVVNTGQHHDDSMNSDFTRDLGMRVDVDLAPAPSPDTFPGHVLNQAIGVIAARGPDAVLLLGDTLTVPLFALAARRAGVPAIHLEAGMRSLNGRSLEEVNRKMAAAAASIHFAPTALSAAFLVGESVAPERIFTVGNTVTDALRLVGPPRVPVEQRMGVLLTAHRASNVDSPERLGRIVDLALRLAELGPVTFPVHPRTAMRLREFDLAARLEGIDDLTPTGPLDYAPMLHALAETALVVTDSGGIQEECSWYGVPAIVLRRSTPRWEGVRDRTVFLCGIDTDDEVRAARGLAARLLKPDERSRIDSVTCPYGDGWVSRRIADVLASPDAERLLALTEDPVDLAALPWPPP